MPQNKFEKKKEIELLRINKLQVQLTILHLFIFSYYFRCDSYKIFFYKYFLYKLVFSDMLS